MKLSQLTQDLPYLEKKNYSEQNITEITFDSRRVKSGNLFVAIAGLNSDGHQFISQAVEKGAGALIVEKDISPPSSIPILRVKNSRQALSHLAATWYGNPSKDLQIIGVTGTNGKTTVTYLLHHILEQAGLNSGRIGTIGYQFGQQLGTLSHTTPDALEIHRLLAAMKSQGTKTVAMEVSSHALDLNRVDHVHFDLAVFMNLTPEHLDYHASMEEYFESKQRLFTHLLKKNHSPKRAIINAEDSYGLRLMDRLKELKQEVWNFSTQSQSQGDCYIKEWEGGLNETHGLMTTPVGEAEFSSQLIGNFNLSNILAATAVSLSLGLDLKAIFKAIKTFNQVPGRLERIPNSKGIHIFVDYAHTPDALKNVLETLRALKPSRIITVFGCGGDRDRSKRPLMGQEAARLSNQIIVTSDNPRTEDPLQIIKEIIPGIKKGMRNLAPDYSIEPDRKKAIELALSIAKKDDVVLIAGKGHENYQIVDQEKIGFDDRKIAGYFI